MPKHTDRQLVKDWLKNFWAVTTGLTLLMVLLNILSYERGLFAAQFTDPLVNLLALDMRDPFRFFGINWITSAFVHSSFLHLASNFLWFLGFGLYVEHAKSPWKMVQVFALGHLVGASLAWVSNQDPDIHFILGASSGALALIGYCVTAFKTFFFYFAGATALLLSLVFSDGPSSHVLPLGLGVLFGRIEALWNSKS